MGRSIAGITGSNPAEGMDVRLLNVCVSCRYRPLRGVDHSFVRVLPRVCLIVCVI